ncbi:MAG: hypothetical protein PHN37_01300 [Candidatus Pacebacteria bacterium]|nr:hypothetical protein [Candidatus Paceibacterota bacterium]
MSRYCLDKKEKALILREKGYSIKEISKEINVAQSTSSVWVRNIKLNNRAKERLYKRKLLSYYKSSLSWNKKREEEKKHYFNIAKILVNKIKFDINQSKIYCALLYWCEGGKTYSSSVRFINSDPALVKTFLSLFRKAFKVNEGKFRVLMHLHSYHDEKKQKNFWSNLTKIPKSQFNQTYLKSNTKKRIKENYPGCIAIYYYDCKIIREIKAIYEVFSKKMGM